MKNNGTIDLAVYAVRGDDGSVDFEETLAKFERDVLAWEEDRKNGRKGVLKALHTVFDKHVGKSLPMDYLTTQVCKVLGADSPEEFSTISEQVPETVKSNPTVFEQTRRLGTCRLADKAVAAN